MEQTLINMYRIKNNIGDIINFDLHNKTIEKIHYSLQNEFNSKLLSRRISYLLMLITDEILNKIYRTFNKREISDMIKNFMKRTLVLNDGGTIYELMINGIASDESMDQDDCDSEYYNVCDDLKFKNFGNELSKCTKIIEKY